MDEKGTFVSDEQGQCRISPVFNISYAKSFCAVVVAAASVSPSCGRLQ